MPINFDALPGGKPNAIPAKGTYYATIEKAEMKQGKDTAKPPYLNMCLALQTSTGESAGKMYDMLFDSNHELVKYKLRRFITALNIPVTGAFELEDICKIISGKRLIVDVTHDEKSEPAKAVVDVFSKEIYYPIAEASNLFSMVPVIDAPDAEDAQTTTPGEVSY